MSMIRQLGCPTIFLTLSAAETKWLELLKILKQILDDVNLSVEEVLEFQWSERADLIRRDPVTCAWYFDHRSKELFNAIKLSIEQVFVNRCDLQCPPQLEHIFSNSVRVDLFICDSLESMGVANSISNLEEIISLITRLSTLVA